MAIDIDVNPFQEMIINFSKTLSYTPVTKTLSNMSGNETLTPGTPSNISGAFFRKEDSWSQDKAGLFQGADAILLVLPNISIKKNGIITYQGENYRIEKDLISRRLGSVAVYNVAQLWKK